MKLTERIKSAISTRSNFSLSYDGVLSGDWGDIIPVVCKEMVPTDNFTVDAQVFMRMAPLASPTFGRIHGFVNHFFVPNRILMPEYAFEDSITGGNDGTAPESFPFVTYRLLAHIGIALYEDYSLSHYRRFLKLISCLGLGKLASTFKTVLDDYFEEVIDIDDVNNFFPDDSAHSISWLPFAAIFRIIGDYYFPYGLETDAEVREALHKKYSGLMTFSAFDANDEIVNMTVGFSNVVACYTKDYFTSAFTRPQRGESSLVPVDIAGRDLNAGLGSGIGTGNRVVAQNYLASKVFNAAASNVGSYTPPEGTTNVIGQFEAHVMKYAEKLQAFLERNNIAGGRYLEQMLARFGVKIPDAVLQRSRLLSGSDFWVNVSDVTATNGRAEPGSVQMGLGEQAGKGIALGKDNTSFRADEYGFYIALFHFVPETGYVDGLEKMWTRKSRFDYWTPELEDTGMQPIYNKELNLCSTIPDYGSNPDGVFGYVPRYSEYKFANPILAGDFCMSSDSILSKNLLDSYHLYRRIKDPYNPVLNVEFVRVDPLGNTESQEGQNMENNFNRIFQIDNDEFDHFWINTQVSIGANRPMIGFAEAGLEFANDSGSGSVNVSYGGLRL